jgi:hypothetical protein
LSEEAKHWVKTQQVEVTGSREELLMGHVEMAELTGQIHRKP